LHFDEPLLKALADKGIRSAYVTLHVGAGTFTPLRCENALAHKMHAERIEVSKQTASIVNETRARGGRIVAVGTTSLRTLESAWGPKGLATFKGETAIFITPGTQIKSADILITNFHLPETTLLMLVSAFAGHQNTMRAYAEAVTEKYRFFSYGDAMIVTRHETRDVPEG
jgi:S-adenosylmethionine:tRNA ribosyltransferase-isomerase